MFAISDTGNHLVIKYSEQMFLIMFLVILCAFFFFETQMAFVLYPKNRDHAWDLSDHSNVMFLTICFCLYYALTYAIIGINYALITW